MTRRVVLDTETTGLEVAGGHRVIEIGCVELVDRRATGRTFHCYLNPERAVDAGAVAVHGITDDFLRDKPRFADVADEFLAFIDGAELLIHNAAFDIGFLDAEMKRAQPASGRVSDHASVVDTLELARRTYPGQKNTLDALCKRLEVDNSRRDVHGALLDAQLLADVWIAMTAGQCALSFGGAETAAAHSTSSASTASTPALGRLDARPRIQRANKHEAAAHAARLDGLDKASGGSLWRREQPAG